jgi:hypothetical protein
LIPKNPESEPDPFPEPKPNPLPDPFPELKPNPFPESIFIPVPNPKLPDEFMLFELKEFPKLNPEELALFTLVSIPLPSFWRKSSESKEFPPYYFLVYSLRSTSASLKGILEA